ncbi:MAG: RdgB/HAM1 family non-canonical purine NTP pyrophosphatase [Burkholderiales bacterium]|nr:MAG: RdgB/HAM1 family non-canonical purine NTP pyrophosphatase [Burkholderiales bacterium]
MGRIVLASNNAGKLRELRALLEPMGVELVAQGELGVGEIDEPHPSFVENALAKARHASRATGLPAIADDSGICVEALGGAPGVRSARFAAEGGMLSLAAAQAGRDAIDRANNAHLIERLQALGPTASRDAYYYCALVLVRSPEDPQPVIADGLWPGTIVAEPRGSGGFGYDPHFLLPDLGKTAAELAAEHKNRVSHRGMALRAMVDKLQAIGLVAPAQ